MTDGIRGTWSRGNEREKQHNLLFKADKNKMRFRLILGINRRAFGDLLPINYQYELSSAIYRILSQASAEYASWLHDNGFSVERGKHFKLFCFSRLKIEQRQIMQRDERIRIISDSVEWQISFLPEQSTEKFVQGVFANRTFEIGDKKSVVQFQVRSIESLPSPEFGDTADFATMSPLCLRFRRDDGSTEYLSPTDERAKAAILTGLLSRYEVFHNEPFTAPLDFDFTVLNEPKSVLVKIKSDTPEQTKVRGFMCRFRMRAPKELMRIMYDSGIGEECAQGFGCVRVMEKPPITNDRGRRCD